MVAITMQGLLYTLATTILGWNALGVFIGGALMGAWASSQGFFVQYLMLGSGIEKAYNESARWVAKQTGLEAPAMMSLVLGIVIVNALLAGITAFVLWRRRSRLRKKLEAWMENPISVSRIRKKKGLLSLGLLLPTAIVAGILLSTGTKWDDVALMVGRAIAVGMLLFALIQRWDPARLIGFLRRKGKWGPAYALSSAIEAKEQK